MTARVLLTALVAISASALAADPPKVGDEAPKFKAEGSLINPPEFARSLQDCLGDVILIYEWNARDGTKAGISDIQTYYTKWAGVGLHVWTIYRLDYEKFPQVDIMARQEGWTIPICMGGFYDDKNDFFGYKEGKTFRNCVIGVDGKVAYYGKGDGWKAPLDAELEKLVYPNLGKHVVAEGAELPAKKLAKREFGKALLECEKMLAGELSAEVKADVEIVARRANQLATARLDRVKAAKDDKRYDVAIKTLTLLDEEFAGHKISDDAELELKEFKKDKAIKKEIDAYESLDKLIAKDGKGDPQTFVNSLQAFAKSHTTVRAGTVADAMAKRLKADLE